MASVASVTQQPHLFKDQNADSGNEGRIGQAGHIKIAVTLWGGYPTAASLVLG